MPAVLRLLVPVVLPLLVSCSIVSGQGRGMATGKPFALRPGESVAVAESGTLRYERLVNDSRCRPDVQCIWAGDAEVAFTWIPNGATPDAFSLHTRPNAGLHALGPGRQLRLLSLERGDAPTATLQVDTAP
jgi:hypothetical protein